MSGTTDPTDEPRPERFCPGPPGWRLDWDGIDESFEWVHFLRGCPQDPIHHAEGDVWTHVRMVCEELADLPAWRALPGDEREAVFLAALLHDVGKPFTTRLDGGGRIRSFGHPRRGAILAREILWGLDVPRARRELIVAMIQYHQVPYFLIDQPAPERLAIESSLSARNDLLAVLAEADVRGRTCEDKQKLLDNVALFEECCRLEDCLTRPRAFGSEETRVRYFRTGGCHPDSEILPQYRAEVVLLSGLPAAGKSHWARRQYPDWPTVTLDDIRSELEIEPDEDQGRVVQRARETARDHLRAGRSFVWNATNVSRRLRRGCVELFTDYQARVTIVSVEAPAVVVFDRNRRRPNPVPFEVMHNLIRRWEVPTLTEAHAVEWVDTGEE